MNSTNSDQTTSAVSAGFGHPALLAGDRRLLRNDVYELLLEQILFGDLAPGERLRDSDMTDWLQVSRTPVREAISRLATVGLVRTAPNRYTVVTPIAEDEVEDAIAVLRRIYPDAVTEAIRSIDDDAELELRLLGARLLRDPDESPVVAFRRMMRVLLASLRNRVLADAVEAVQLRFIRYLAVSAAADRVLSAERVAAFADAVCARDRTAIVVVQGMLDDAEALVSRSSAAV